jgi:hypothetical protein
MAEPYNAADLARARRCKLSFSRTGLAQLIADVRAEQRERDAKLCAALEAQFAASAARLQHSHSERAEVLRAQADGCAYCTEALGDGDHSAVEGADHD